MYEYFYELVGISTAQAITIKNDWQWWEIRNERNRIIRRIPIGHKMMMFH